MGLECWKKNHNILFPKAFRKAHLILFHSLVPDISAIHPGFNSVWFYQKIWGLFLIVLLIYCVTSIKAHILVVPKDT